MRDRFEELWDYTELDGIAEDRIRHWLADGHGRPVLVLKNIEAADKLEEWLGRNADGSVSVFLTARRRAPFLKISGGWESFWGAKTAKFRHNIDRSERKLRELGARLERLEEPGDVNGWIESSFSLYRKRWSGLYNASAFGRRENAADFKVLAGDLLRQGKLDFTRLAVDGAPISFAFSLVERGVYYFWIHATDNGAPWGRYSPGQVLIKNLVERACRRGLTGFDFMVGDEDYKRHWTNEARQLTTCVLARKDVFSRLAGLSRAAGIELKFRARNSPVARFLAGLWRPFPG